MKIFLKNPLFQNQTDFFILCLKSLIPLKFYTYKFHDKTLVKFAN